MTQGNNLYRVGPRMARKYIERCILAGLVPFLQSSPGMGKSEITHAVADFFDLCLIDHRLSTSPPEDMSGLPAFKDGYAYFAPFRELFPLVDATPPINPKTGKPYSGWMIFLDEFNSARKETQAAAYKLILDRMVGQHKLHPDCVIAAAGNLSTDRAIVNPIGSAMQSRVAHIEMMCVFEEWLYDVALPQNYDQRIIAFLSQHPELLMDFKPDHKGRTFCCPRTWSFVNRLTKGYNPESDKVEELPITDDDTALFAGTITEGVAASFVQFTKVYADIPKVADIIADPHHHHVPSSLDMLWAVTGALLSNMTPQNFEKISIYADRLDTSMRILFYRSVMVRMPELRQHKAFTNAMISLSQHLRG